MEMDFELNRQRKQEKGGRTSMLGEECRPNFPDLNTTNI